VESRGILIQKATIGVENYVLREGEKISFSEGGGE
jgi:hypothetical protein